MTVPPSSIESGLSVAPGDPAPTSDHDPAPTSDHDTASLPTVRVSRLHGAGPRLIADSAALRSLDEVVGEGVPTISVAPVLLDAPGRSLPLEVRVSAPITGDRLPVIVFSHGNGSSLDGYAPMTAFWASHGFVVVQPTHLDSRRNGIGFGDPRFGTIWTERYRDLRRVIDQLDGIEGAVPGLSGRVDHGRILAAGHSWGAQTAQMLLGARVVQSDGSLGEDYRDPRISAGVLFAATGVGGDHLVPFATESFPFADASFTGMTTPTLVIAGDRDQSRLSTRGPDWFTDAYTHGTGATDLVTLLGAEHFLGGISGYAVTETTDEDPGRVAVLQRLTTAYLRSATDPTDVGWERVRSIVRNDLRAIGRIDSK